MRILSDTLLAAQQQAVRTPKLEVSTSNRVHGAVKLHWQHVYQGEEENAPHTAVLSQDGALIRARVASVDTVRSLWWQRVAEPGEQSDFSQWTAMNQYGVLAVELCSYGSEVLLFWVKNNDSLYLAGSDDCGITWDNGQVIEYPSGAGPYSLAASFDSGGTCALFYTDGATLYVKKRISAVWQSAVAWSETTGNLSDIAAFYNDDWNLVVTGEDSDGNSAVWSIVYGNGSELPEGSWSTLKTVRTAPSGSGFSYGPVFLDKPDVFRCMVTEICTAGDGWSKPQMITSVAGKQFSEGLWQEWLPFGGPSGCGLALLHTDAMCWLSSPSRVWQAVLTEQDSDLSNLVYSLEMNLSREEGTLRLTLDNSNGQAGSLTEGESPALERGNCLVFSPGYRTADGEVSRGLSFIITSLEQEWKGNRSVITVCAADGWQQLKDWTARYQMVWNTGEEEVCLKGILQDILARVGLSLEVISSSVLMNSFCPRFTVYPGQSGLSIVRKALSMTQDVVFIEGSRAFLMNPLPDDIAIFQYSVADIRRRQNTMEVNRIVVAGYDPGLEEELLAECVDEDEIRRAGERYRYIENREIATIEEGEQLGEALLRQAALTAETGVIRVPVNCGLQLYDVLAVTDGSGNEYRHRVTGIRLLFQPQHSIYEQQITLGAV